MSLIGLLDEPPVLEEGGQKYKVQFTVKANPKLLRAELLQGRADMAVIPTTLAAILYNKGVPYRAAAVTVWGTLALVGKKQTEQTEPFDWNDLKEKEIHLMGKGMTPDILFRLLLEKKGLTNEVKVNYRFPAPQDLAQAMAAGAVELAVLSEPMASTAMARNKEIAVLADLTEEWNKTVGDDLPLPQAVLIVKTSFARKHPQLVARFLAQYRSQVDRINSHTLQAAQLMVKHGLVPDAAVGAASIPRCHLRFRLAGEVKDQIKAYLGVFFQMNPAIVGGGLPDENFYYGK